MPESKIHPEDQIGLPSLKTIIIQFFRAFFKICSFIFAVLAKHKFFLTFVLLAGLIAGYLYTLARPEYYKVSMIVQSSSFPKKTYAEIISQLNGYIGNGSKKLLARDMNLSEDLAAKFIYVDSRNLSEEPLSTDTSSKTRQSFKIMAGLIANTSPDSLQDGIIYYINNSPYLKTLKAEEQKINEAKLAHIESDLKRIDSLKTQYNLFLTSPARQSNIYFSSANPADFYIETQKLLERREETIKSLSLDAHAVTVIDGFKLTLHPQSLSMPISVLFFGIAGFMLVFIILFLVELKKRISSPVPFSANNEK